MSLVTDKPAELKPQNDLDKIPADLLGPIPAEIRLGANVLMMMDKPPEVKDVITVVMRLRVKDEGKGEAGDGGDELVHYRRCKIVAAWLQGERPPTAEDDDQPPLFGTDGEAEPEALGEILNGVERPQFSNLTGDRDD